MEKPGSRKRARWSCNQPGRMAQRWMKQDRKEPQSLTEKPGWKKLDWMAQPSWEQMRPGKKAKPGSTEQACWTGYRSWMERPSWARQRTQACLACCCRLGK